MSGFQFRGGNNGGRGNHNQRRPKDKGFGGNGQPAPNTNPNPAAGIGGFNTGGGGGGNRGGERGGNRGGGRGGFPKPQKGWSQGGGWPQKAGGSQGGGGFQGEGGFQSGGGFQGGGGQSRPPRQNLCREFQKDKCNNPNCPNTHAYSVRGDVNKVQRVPMAAKIFQMESIDENQVAVVMQGGIKVINIINCQEVSSFPINFRINCIKMTPALSSGASYLIFAGGDRQSGAFGSINCTDGSLANLQLEAPVNDLAISETGLIFAACENGSVSVIYFDGQAFQFGTSMPMDQILMCAITKITLVGTYVLGGTVNGFIYGWNYNFNDNTSQGLGQLQPVHQGRINSLIALENRFLFSAADDGIVNCWDSQMSFQGGTLLNTSQKKPTKVTSLSIMPRGNVTLLLVGTLKGDISIYELNPGQAKFLFPITPHGMPVFHIASYVNSAYQVNGFLSASGESILILAWS